MEADKARSLNALVNQLSKALMTAAICAQEIKAAVCSEVINAEFDHSCNGMVSRRLDSVERPLLDESTLSVIWKGKTLHLGNTLAFRFLERLARCPNQYVSHLELLRDVWEDEYLSTASIRSLVRELRRKLGKGGLSELADAIRAQNGHYVLSL